MRSIAGLLLTCCAFSVQAEIYKFVDDSGHVTYTNLPRPGSKKLDIEASPPSQLPKIDATGKSLRPRSKSSGRGSSLDGLTAEQRGLKVDGSTQSRRDDMRRQLLQEELDGEQRNLAAARSALLGAGRRTGSETDKLVDAVKLHEKNIEMLNKELANIR